MKKTNIIKSCVLIIAAILALAGCAQNTELRTSGEGQGIAEKLEFSSISGEFNFTLLQYKIGWLSKEEMLNKLQDLMTRIEEYYISNAGKVYTFDEWVFPLEGYGPNVIGGRNGSGFVSKDFSFFEPGGLKGHPAHDIFIHDKNQDNIDDKTGKPVNVLSMTGGVVLSTRESWAESDSSKGGKYIWVYDPMDRSIFYYAHNSTIFVKEGDVVKPGDVIAEVGRTGENAFEPRSPTHLHLGMFKVVNGVPQPHNYYTHLVKAKQK